MPYPQNETFVNLINTAINTGKEVTFIIDSITYEFTPEGILEFILANLGTISGSNLVFTDLPTADLEILGQLWNNGGVLTVSAGEVE